MRILGIDPGYATIGFGMIEANRGQNLHMLHYGAIITPAGLPLSRRLYQIGQDVEELIAKLKPDVIAVEELFFNNNAKTAFAVHGIVRFVAVSRNKLLALFFTQIPDTLQYCIHDFFHLSLYLSIIRTNC